MGKRANGQGAVYLRGDGRWEGSDCPPEAANRSTRGPGAICSGSYAFEFTTSGIPRPVFYSRLGFIPRWCRICLATARSRCPWIPTVTSRQACIWKLSKSSTSYSRPRATAMTPFSRSSSSQTGTWSVAVLRPSYLSRYQ